MIIETASIQTRSYGEEVIARAPDHVRAAINRKRVKSGMAPVLSIRDYERLDQERRAAEVAAVELERRRTAGVWIERGGRLVPVTTSKTRKPAATRTSSKGPVVTRVLLVAAYGDATAADVRGRLPETIAADAFGRADELNRSRGWQLRDGHGGPMLATAGERLRAHDTSAGLVVEWIPNLAFPWDGEAVRAIENGSTAVSVGMKIAETRTVRLPRPTTMVTRAKLTHLAILRGDERPCYAGARAIVFRAVWRDDPDTLRRNLDAAIERARWFDRQARSR